MSVLRANVKEANSLLKTLGVGVDLDMSKVVNAQMKKSLQEIMKLSQEVGRKQEEAAKQGASAMKAQAQHYRNELQEVQRVTKLLDEDLRVVGMRVEGINREGMKTTFRTDDKGNVLAGSKVSLDALLQQKKELAEIRGLYQQQEAQLRAIYDLRGKMATAGGEKDALAGQIAQREQILASLKKETDLRSQGFDTSAQERHVASLRSELERKLEIRQATATAKEEQKKLNKEQEQSEQINQQIVKTITTMVT